MTTAELSALFEKLMLQATTWKQMPGVEEHPEASAFECDIEGWRFLVMGAPPDPTGAQAIGGTATNMKAFAFYIMPLEVAARGWQRAREILKLAECQD